MSTYGKTTAGVGMDRRHLLGGLTAALVASPVLSTSPALAQRRAPAVTEVPEAELMKPTGLPELVQGRPDAPVTIIEYASMTCSHCANFHNNVFPKLKEKYIDTGKVRFILRDFPLDNLAAAAAMLARCAGGEATHAMIGALFKTQEQWAFVRGNPVPELFKIARQAGFTQERFDTCLKDSKTLDAMIEARERASKVFGVNSTPTFFINGKRMMGRSDSIEAFDRAIEPLLKG